MNKQIIVVDFEFDYERFTEDIYREVNFVTNNTNVTLSEISVIELGLSEGYLSSLLSTSRKDRTSPYPNMTNFLKICNYFHLDPRNYFSLKINE